MMKEEYLLYAKEALRRDWGFDGELVLDCIADTNPVMGSITMGEFLQDCSACGGNWGGMFLTGIRRRWPAVYAAIPDDMGSNAFECICSVLMLCGVDTTA